MFGWKPYSLPNCYNVLGKDGRFPLDFTRHDSAMDHEEDLGILVPQGADGADGDTVLLMAELHDRLDALSYLQTLAQRLQDCVQDPQGK